MRPARWAGVMAAMGQHPIAAIVVSGPAPPPHRAARTAPYAFWRWTWAKAAAKSGA